MGYPEVQLLGVVLLAVGLAYYAKAKERHPAWGVLGFFTIIGVIALACFKDHAPKGEAMEPEPEGKALKICLSRKYL